MKVHKFLKYNKILVLFLFVFACLFNNLYAEDELVKKQYPKDNTQTGNSWQNSRDFSSSLFKTQAEELGLQKYVRLSKHDGNLVETGWVNQGQLADGYISGPSWPMIWPRGSGTEYGYVFVFFVAGEVVDAHGDVIHIVSDRFHRTSGSSSEQSTDKSHWWDFKPLPKYFNNHHPSSTDWDISGISEDVGMDGYPNTNDLGEGDGELQQGEDFNRNGILDLDMVNVAEWAAMSHLPETWPTYWPPQSYEGDDRAIGEERPGPCAGRWNGEYGYYIRASQESYYVMDDRENDEFDYYPFNLPGTDTPDDRPWPDGRRGLGITVEVRNYQWVSRLAEDILISIYDITNYGKKLNKCVVGMYGDVDVGGTSSGDDADFDVVDDITYIWDKSGLSNHGLPTGYFGFAFLESPGLSSDKKDNDLDGMIDESQYNLDDEDMDWRVWQDDNGNGIYDTEDLNYNGELDAGEDANGNNKLDWELVWDDVGSDGLGPDDEGYPGPDANGTEANGIPDQGEPNFGKTDNDESDQVGLTSWYLKKVDNRVANDDELWEVELIPGTFAIGEDYSSDVAFDYGSGYIEIEPGVDGTQRYAIACLFGNDEMDIFRNKRTMQKIYDSDYNFSKPPRIPIVTAIPSSNKVVLMWDDGSEKSKDPIYGRDFEMYKIYKSTDPNFSDIKTISDAFGNPLLYEPVAQYDLVDGLVGPHPIPIGGTGEDDGLDLGVAYDMGTDSGLRHTFVDTNLTNGRTYYYAVVGVDKGYNHDFYERGLSDKDNLAPNSPTECSSIIQVDALGRPVFIDRNCAVIVPVEPAAGYMEPRTENGLEHISGDGTGSISLQIIIPDSVRNDHTYQLVFKDDAAIEEFDEAYPTGYTEGAWLIDLTENDTLLTPSIKYDQGVFEDLILTGFRLKIENDDSIAVSWSGWERGRSNISGEPQGYAQQTRAIPRDYRITVGDVGIDTSYSQVPGRALLTNFTVEDVTDPDSVFKAVFGLAEDSEEPDSLRGILSHGDKISIKAAPLIFSNLYIYTENAWRIDFSLPQGLESSQQRLPQKGDIYSFKTVKPFDRDDVFEFKIVGGDYTLERARAQLDNIYTVPDPYIAASSLEPRLVNQDIGRGERKIEFVNLPKECKISIFTVAGRLVRELSHSAGQIDGREVWDLRTKDGLEVAHGVYFYHVDAPNIGTKIGKLAIIK